MDSALELDEDRTVNEGEDAAEVTTMAKCYDEWSYYEKFFKRKDQPAQHDILCNCKEELKAFPASMMQETQAQMVKKMQAQKEETEAEIAEWLDSGECERRAGTKSAA